MVPAWLHILSILSLLSGVICAAVIVYDVARFPQKMWIMNIVWPVTALFGSALSLWGYFKFGRLATAAGEADPQKATPFWAKVAKGAAHCGSGCALGDICAEWLTFLVPALAIWFGWNGIFSEKIFAVWVIDYLFAFAFGIAFQYFTIKPMRDIGPAAGLMAAIKADALSLTAWQIGMYGFMAVAHFWIFKDLLNVKLSVAMPEFWFMMQIAMLCGFLTSYPVNWRLIRTGIKEEM